MPSKRKISKKTNTKRRTRSFKKRGKKKMTKKMKRIGKRLLKTKGIKLPRYSKKRLTSAKKRKSKKIKKKKRSKRKTSAKGMPTKPVEIDIGDIDTDNLETPQIPSPITPTTPEDTTLQPVTQNNIEFPTFSDDGNDININVDNDYEETVKENKGLNFNELVDFLNNADNNNSLVLNRYRYSNGDVYKTEIQLDNYDDDSGVLTIIDMDDMGRDFIQREDFYCNYGEEDDPSFCYTHGHAREMPNKNVDVYEIPQN